MSIFSIAKWLSEAIFKVSNNLTTFDWNIEFICNIFTSYWVVCLNVWSIHSQLSFIVVIWYTNCLDVIFVSSIKLSSVKPYLVVNLFTTFNWLSIQVFQFVVWCIISVRVSICICNLVSQFFIIINELSTCNIEFRFRNNIFFRIELRCFWWANFVVELFVVSARSVTASCRVVSNSLKNFTFFSNFNSYFSYHSIVRYSSIFTWYFFHSVSECLTKICFAEQEFFKLDVTIFIVGYCLKNLVVLIFQYEAELTCSQLTSFKSFSIVELEWNWNVVFTCLSWFVRSCNFLIVRVVLVDSLVGCIFNINTVVFFNILNSCWDIKFIVTTKLEFSCIDNWSCIFIADRLSQACFRWTIENTVFNLDVELISNICTSLTIVNFDFSRIDIKLIFFVVISDTYSLKIAFCCEVTSVKPYLIVDLLTTFEGLTIQVLDFNFISWIIVIGKFVTNDVKAWFWNNIFFRFEVRVNLVIEDTIVCTVSISTYCSVRNDSC